MPEAIEEPIDPEAANEARADAEETKAADDKAQQSVIDAANEAARTAATEAATAAKQDADKARADYQDKLGKLFGGSENGVSPTQAVDCVNMFSGDVSTFTATFKDGGSSTSLDLTNVNNITDQNLNQLINKFNGKKPTADLLRQVLSDMETPGERAIFLSELFDTQITFDMNKISGGPIRVTSGELNATLPYVRRLFEGKGAENLKNFKVNGVDYTISDSEGVKKGGDQLLNPDQLNDLKQNLENYKQAREEYEEALKKKNLDDIVKAKQKELAMRKRIDNLLEKLPELLQTILILAAGFVILHYVLKGGKEEAKRYSGCYLITDQTTLTDPSSKCYSNTFKIDVDDEDGKYNCDDPSKCCNTANFQFDNTAESKYSFKNNEGAPSYWWVLDSKKNVNCSGDTGEDNITKKTLPAYRSQTNLKCDLAPLRPQALSANAKKVLLNYRSNFNFTGGLPANFWNNEGSVTYGIRKLDTADGVANLACQVDDAVNKFAQTIGKTILYIGGAIVLLFVIYYFIKFEYDKHDGKVKAKYRKAKYRK